MNKKTLLAGAAAAAVVMVMLLAAVMSDDISEIGENDMGSIPYTSDGDTLIPGSLPDVLFEGYGPVLLVLAILMFGAIIGGAYIAKEEDDEDDTD